MSDTKSIYIDQPSKRITEFSESKGEVCTNCGNTTFGVEHDRSHKYYKVCSKCGERAKVKAGNESVT